MRCLSVGTWLLAMVLTAVANGGVMFWLEDGSIYRSGLDGSNPQRIVEATASHGDVNNIDVDPVNQKLYYNGRIGELYEDSVQFVRRCNLDGSGVKTLTKTGDSDPSVPLLLYGFAADPSNDRLYMGSPLRRMNMDGSGMENLPPYYPNHPYYPHDIEIDATNSKLYYTDAVSYNGIKRAELDGTGVENILDLGSVNSGATYLALDTENGDLYYGQRAATEIGRIDLTDFSQETILDNVNVWDIDLDKTNDKMYWISDAEILRSNLDGSKVEALVTLGNAPRGRLALYLPVPEPSSFLLWLGLSAMGGFIIWWRKRK